jgi:hypothetical protein
MDMHKTLFAFNLNSTCLFELWNDSVGSERSRYIRRPAFTCLKEQVLPRLHIVVTLVDSSENGT